SRSSLPFFFSSRRRHTRSKRDWSSDVCSSDLPCHARRTASTLPRAPHGEHAAMRTAHRPHCARRPSKSTRYALPTTAPPAFRTRSEERRVGKECRNGGSPADEKKIQIGSQRPK